MKQLFASLDFSNPQKDFFKAQIFPIDFDFKFTWSHIEVAIEAKSERGKQTILG